MSDFSRKITLPNFLSALRVILLPPLLYYMSRESAQIEMALLVFIMVLSDIADGFLARKMGQVSDIGKVVDPLADKMCSTGIGIGIVIFKGFPLWALIIVVLRDLLILCAGLVIMKKRDVVVVSNWLGKLTVIILALAMISYMFNIEIVKIYLLYLALIFQFVSLAYYYKVNYMKNNR